ncbi:hypothetical protein E2C01_028229 [Portunus trituberculatus]|uniref:Uncharacterized protein n=1 Tax=Portunus trituberculatus TaxID=210409 RepID=A0A5B7ENM3_PORTR|nr:hypothetical protein [Portunus trituberculatus]
MQLMPRYLEGKAVFKQRPRGRHRPGCIAAACPSSPRPTPLVGSQADRRSDDHPSRLRLLPRSPPFTLRRG